MNTREMVVWVVAIVLAAGVLVSPAACTMNRHRLIADAIKNGVHPMAAKCAIESDVSYTPNCILLAADRTKVAKQ